MEIKGLITEDFLQYKKPSMVVLFPSCTFKCDKECKSKVCQNSELALAPSIVTTPERITEMYTRNAITQAICFGGLEPFDSFKDMLELIKTIRSNTDDDIVIYTGYREDEILDKIELLSHYPNMIVKFGRFKPEKDKTVYHFDDVLGVSLASANQYAKVISADGQTKGAPLTSTHGQAREVVRQP